MNIKITDGQIYSLFNFVLKTEEKYKNSNLRYNNLKKNTHQKALDLYNYNNNILNIGNKFTFKNYTRNLLILLYIILINNIIIPTSSKKLKPRNLVSDSIIIMKINYPGYQEIINENFYPKPEIYINEEIKYLTENKIDLNPNDIIKLNWTYQLDTCKNMFANITNILEIDLSNFDFSQIESLDNMFWGCEALKYITINKDLNTSLVNSMDHMFHECYSLQSLNLSKFDTSAVTNFDYLFSDCNSLSYVDTSSLITSKCNTMKYTFSNCLSLKSLDLSKFDTSLVTDIQGIFNFCNSLIFVDLSNFNTNLVENMEYMFYDCRSLLSLNLKNFNTSLVRNMRRMFSNCSSLTSLNITSFNTKNVKNMQYMFSSCNSLTSIDVSNFNTSMVFTMLHMFSNCNSLLFLDLSSFDTTKVTNMKNMFANCNSLMSLNLSSFNTSLLSNMQEMFSNCKALQSLDISYFNTSSVYNMQKMFYNCITLKSLDLSSFDTSLVTDMGKMFEGCSNLIYINIYNFSANSSLENKNMFAKTRESLIYCLNNYKDVNLIESLLLSKECCINDCGNNWYETYEKNLDEKKNYIKIFDDQCIYDNIEDFSSNFFLTNRIPNASIYSYKIDSNIYELKNKYTNLSFIDFSSEKINYLYNKFNLDEQSSIYILFSDLPSNDSRTATSDYNFKFILENGTELNLSNIDEDFYIDVSVPIRNLNLSNFHYITYFIEQGYDIYNKNSSFYNNICSQAHYNTNDIIIIDRKKEIYPNNVILCKSDCTYKSVNVDDKRIVCECNLNVNSKKEESDNDFLNEEVEESYNFINYLLNKINYNIFICGYLLFSISNYVENISFYLISGTFIVLVIFHCKFSFFGLSQLRIKMFKETPTKSKIKKIILEQRQKINRNATIKLNPSKKKILSIKAKSKRNLTTNPFLVKQKKFKIKQTNSINTQINIYFSNTNQKLNRVKKKNSNKIKKDSNNNVQNNEFYNELPFTRAIVLDNRSIFQLFKSILFQKLELINVLTSKTDIKDILICEYILSLLIDFFFNTFFYSDEVISHKYHNNGKLDFIVTLLITLASNIATSIICHFLNSSNWIDNKLENISEIRNEYKYLILINRFLKFLKLKFICFLIGEIIILFFCFYYIVIFCIVYSQTQISLLTNYIVSLIEEVIKSIIITTLIVMTRRIGISFINVHSYNVSKYINSHF